MLLIPYRPIHVINVFSIYIYAQAYINMLHGYTGMFYIQVNSQRQMHGLAQLFA